MVWSRLFRSLVFRQIEEIMYSYNRLHLFVFRFLSCIKRVKQRGVLSSKRGNDEECKPFIQCI